MQPTHEANDNYIKSQSFQSLLQLISDAANLDEFLAKRRAMSNRH